MGKRALLIALTAVAVALAGCGAAPPPPVEDGGSHAAEASTPRAHSGLGVESEIGGLDEGKVKQAFQKAALRLSACYDKGAERLPYLAGEVSFRLRITHEGGVR